MRYILLILISIATTARGQQVLHRPNDRAIQINQEAITKYLADTNKPDNVAAAMRLLDKAIKTDSYYYNAWNNKLSLQCRQKKYNDALKTAARMQRIFSAETDVHFSYGVLQMKTGHSKEAVTTFYHLVNLYDRMNAQSNVSDNLKTMLVNKALALKLLDKPGEAAAILAKLRDEENDPAVKQYLGAHMARTKEELIDYMMPGRDM